MKKNNICLQKLNCAVFNCLENTQHKILHFEKNHLETIVCAELTHVCLLHNFKTCITFDPVGNLRWGFQHFGFLITVI